MIDISDLELWASKPVASLQLPELICRLIRSTSTKVKGVSIPLGKAIWRGGWDGIVDNERSTEFIPEGMSLWEFGIDKNPEDKAERELQKRTLDPKDQDLSQSTFIFVTPRGWEKKDEWVARQKKMGTIWKDIKVYDGHTLVQWLIESPVQSYWIAKQINRTPDEGFLLPMEFWEDWSRSIDREILPTLVTTGRETIVGNVQNSLAGLPSITAVQASAREEALAFFLAAILQMEIQQREDVLSRAFIVEDEKAFRLLTSNKEALILIVKFQDWTGLNNAVRKGHHILLPLGADDDFTGKMELPRLDRDRFPEILQQMGYSEDRAQKLSKESGRNITVFRRQENFDYNKPKWSGNEWVEELMPILLAGKWDENKAGDRAILETLSGKPYGEFESRLQLLLQEPDAPIKKIGNQWRLSSAFDAWSYLARYGSTNHFDLLKEATLTVLREIDPALVLPVDQRHLVAIHKLEWRHSRWIREGLLQSLIIIGLYGDSFKLAIGSPAQQWVDRIVDTLLGEADSNGYRSLNDVVVLLAEASPDVFVQNLEMSLNVRPSEVLTIFEEGKDSLATTHYHSGYLWALESIAWIPSHLTRAMLLLGQLAMNDPGGRLSNRPANSMKQIFVPWMPQTLASNQQRMESLEVLAAKYPELAWQLAIFLNGHILAQFPTHRFRWRLFEVTLRNDQTYGAIDQFKVGLVARMIGIGGTNGKKLAMLVGTIDRSMPFACRQQIISHIRENIDAIQEERLDLWQEIRKLLFKHRRTPGAGWVLDHIELSALDELLESLTPSSKVEGNIWVFQEAWPEFSDGYAAAKAAGRDLNREVHARRVLATREIREEIGIDGLINLIEEMKVPFYFGEALAEILTDDTEIVRVLELLRSTSSNDFYVVQGYINRKYALSGLLWVQEQLHRSTALGLEDVHMGRLLAALPSGRTTWDLVEAQPEKVAEAYWTLVRPVLYQASREEKQYAVEKLASVGRYRTALSIGASWPTDIDTTMLMAILKSALGAEVAQVYLQPSEIIDVFNELDNRSDVESMALLQLEFKYATILDNSNGRSTERIHQELSANPEFFVEAMAMVYKDDDDNMMPLPEGMSEEVFSSLVERWHGILYQWQRVPGVEADGTIDQACLKSWIAAVMALACNINRSRMAAAFIGKILSYVPTEPDGTPAIFVCEIIESLNSDVVNRNYKATWTNQRGFTSRAVFSGGQIERDWASTLRQIVGRLSGKWPTVAGIYENIAKDYDARAAHEDSKASQLDYEY